MLKKCTSLWREAHFQVRMLKAPHVRTTFGRSIIICVAGARDSAPCQKWAIRQGFVAVSKTMAGVGHMKKICKDACRVAGAVEEKSASKMSGGQGAGFLRGVTFWSIRSSGLLRWFCRCVASAALRIYDLASLFGGRRKTLDRWAEKSQTTLVWGCQLCTQLSILAGNLAELCRIASFLMWTTSKIEEVSQNCCVFDVVNFQISNKSRRIAACR